MYERLPELVEQADFKDLKNAIIETWEDIGNQIGRMKEIHTFLYLQNGCWKFTPQLISALYAQTIGETLKKLGI